MEAVVEFLVTMTTRVPDGVPDDEVADVRAREAVHTRDLAAQGRVLRLWRPPLKPGEWQTLGLFDASDPDDLEQVLSSMPLRVWRTDEVTRLASHPNDPGRDRVPITTSRTEFLTVFTVHVPPDAGAEAVRDRTAQEAHRTAELAADANLVRLWRLPRPDRNLGHWQADDAGQMTKILASLPMAAWLTVETEPLSRHPSDPLAAVRAQDSATVATFGVDGGQQFIPG
jgi:muconolactone delta-isomerase